VCGDGDLVLKVELCAGRLRGPRYCLLQWYGGTVVQWYSVSKWRNMMPRERYFLGKIAIGYWYKRAVPVVGSLFKLRSLLEEVKEQARRRPALTKTLTLTIPPREATTRALQEYGASSRRRTYCIILLIRTKLQLNESKPANDCLSEHCS
jgi:hypothetical protein